MATPAETTFAKANLLFRAGRFVEAAQLYRHVTVLRPRDPRAWYNLGMALHAGGDLPAACRSYEQALRLRPGMIEAASNLGVALLEQGQAAGAAAVLDKAVLQAPSDPDIRINLARALTAIGRGEEARDHLATACARAPDNPSVQYALAQACFDAGELDAAERGYARALELRTDWAEAICGLGNVARLRFDFGQAVGLYRKALSAKPGHVTALINLAIALEDHDSRDEALAALAEAQRLEPANVLAHWNEALLRLAAGDFSRGLERYEWRWRTGEYKPRLFPLPAWDGRAPRGRLLLWGEQGVGDELLFSSLLDDLLARGIDCVLETDPRLAPLLQRTYPQIEVLPRQDPFHPVIGSGGLAAQCPLGSLPLRLGWTAPVPVRSRQLVCNDARRQQLRTRYLELARGRRIIGIAWRSQNRRNGLVRSCPLAEWGPILRQDCLFINLQYGPPHESDHVALASYGVGLHSDPDVDQLANLDDFAAQVSATDLVIAIDNSTVHMAGRLGVPTWVLLNEGFGASWFWPRGQHSSHWYPSLRLFRQSRPGDWATPVNAVAESLRSLPPV